MAPSPLPPNLTVPSEEHAATCFACRPASEGGLGAELEVLDGERIRLSCEVSSAHSSAIHKLHGGVLAALFDEALGTVPPVALGEICVTGTIEVVFRSHAEVGETIVIEAALERIEGRKIFVRGEARVGDRLVGESSGVWIRAA